MMQSLALVVATVAYCGYVPVAPGTAGSAAALLLFAAIRASGSSMVELAALILVMAVGVWSSGVAERIFGRTDPRHVVIDEVAGMLVTLFLLPVGWTGALVGFLSFRVFDIVKPFPARQAERLPRGWGVMTDDLVAGVYAHLLLHVIAWMGWTL